MQLLTDIVSLFYQSESIPLFLYENGCFVCGFPETDLPVLPPEHILDAFRQKTNPVVLHHSETGCIYFKVQADDVFTVYGGPVPLIPPDAETVNALCRDYLIGGSRISRFADYVHRIPPYNPVVLAKKLYLLRYCLSGELRSAVSDDFLIGTDSSVESGEKHETQRAGFLYEAHVDESYNNSFEIEELLQRFIFEGDLDGYMAFVKNVPPMNTGQLAASGLRNTKNNCIVATAIACRTAIRAGVPRETAYALSDSYIKEAEAMTSVEKVLRLNSSVVRDYILRVKHIRETSSGDSALCNPLIRRCVNYIHRNLNHRLSVSEVAGYVGLSRSYLSTLFHQNMGIPLNRFVLNAKLEEASSLLRYSDRSISDIAEYLCFSSQSHFQQAFKAKYKITPRDYRNSTSHPA